MCVTHLKEECLREPSRFAKQRPYRAPVSSRQGFHVAQPKLLHTVNELILQEERSIDVTIEPLIHTPPTRSEEYKEEHKVTHT
jgi:hypothetical protein